MKEYFTSLPCLFGQKGMRPHLPQGATAKAQRQSFSEPRQGMGTTSGSPFPFGPELVTNPSSQSCQGITHPAAWSLHLRQHRPWGKKKHKTEMFESQTKSGWAGLGEAVLTNPPQQQVSIAPNSSWRKLIWLCWSSGWAHKCLNSDTAPPCQTKIPDLHLSEFTWKHHKTNNKKQTRDVWLLLLHMIKESQIPPGRSNLSVAQNDSLGAVSNNPSLCIEQARTQFQIIL